jgi:uncharacterized protein YbjQ (UPF0145 family)
MKEITKVRVLTRNFGYDIISNVQNFFGGRLTKYEEMINKGKNDIWKELKSEGIVLKWFRYEISQLTNGAMVIMLYGEAK